jgi:hypothetical protein
MEFRSMDEWARLKVTGSRWMPVKTADGILFLFRRTHGSSRSLARGAGAVAAICRRARQRPRFAVEILIVSSAVAVHPEAITHLERPSFNGSWLERLPAEQSRVDREERWMMVLT